MAAEDTVTATAGVPTTTIFCEVCKRPLVVATIRIAPSVRQTGWRCARPACAPGKGEGALSGPPTTTTMTTMDATPGEHGGHRHGTP